MDSRNTILSAAIDFGTTYSGWAFSFKHEYETEPTRIFSKQFSGGGQVSLKAPTTVLLTPEKEFHSFGYEAETKYAQLVSGDKNEHENWYYFRRFKMMLYAKMNLDKDIYLEDETKKRLPAKRVFSLVIRYLKEDMLKDSKDRTSTLNLKEDEITWVLTTPAIWTDAAKQFMTQAAVEAGIKKKNLKIALEPEAASIFCCHLATQQLFSGENITSFTPGTVYMVLDAGGGTVDITVHEVLSDKTLKELHQASGGAWGGTQVDESYQQFLISLVGDVVFQRFQLENKEDYLEMFREFELKKRDIAPTTNNDDNVTVRFPVSLNDIYEHENGSNIRTNIAQTKYANEVFFKGDKLRLKASVMKGFFSNAIECTVSHVKEILNDTNTYNISSILMVGGFSDSEMLKHAIRSSFKNVKIVNPIQASLVVLKGAVIFGHKQSSIAKRVCRYTYGTAVAVPFDNKKHDIKKKINGDDGPKCNDIFDKYVEMGQTVALNETTNERSYIPLTESESYITLTIYASNQKYPTYVTDEGCVRLGQVTIGINKKVRRKKRTVLCSLTFGGTEIEVTAKEKRTGMSAKATVDFLG